MCKFSHLRLCYEAVCVVCIVEKCCVFFVDFCIAKPSWLSVVFNRLIA